MENVLIALAAFLGGIAIALKGWAESHEPWDGRKFCASVIRSLFAGALYGLSYQFLVKEMPSGIDYLFAFLGGAGFDTGVNGIAGLLGNGQFPLPRRRSL